MIFNNSFDDSDIDELNITSINKMIGVENSAEYDANNNPYGNFSNIFQDSKKPRKVYSGEELKLPSSSFREYKYFELNNGTRVVLLMDVFDIEMSIGIHYPVHLLRDCNDVGGLRLLSNVLVKGLKEYFRDIALTKVYSISVSDIYIIFSSMEDKYRVLSYISHMFENFDISIEKFIVSYKNTLKQYLRACDTKYYRITSKFIELAHEGSYIKSSSCFTYPKTWLDVNNDVYELAQLRRKVVNYIRRNMSSNLLTLIFTVPDCLLCTQNIIVNTLSSMKNLDIKYQDIFDKSKYVSPFSPNNIIGMKLMLPTPFPTKQFFFCFYISEQLESSVDDLEEALSYLFITSKNSLSDILKEMNLAKSVSIKIFLPEKSPILSFSIDIIEGSNVDLAKLLAVVRHVIYSFSESPMLEKYVKNYFNSRRVRYNTILYSASTDNVTQSLFKLIDRSPIDDLASIYNPKRLLSSIETILSYSTFENFFMIESYTVSSEELKNSTISVEHINLEFWNAIEPSIIPSFTVIEPDNDDFVPKLFHDPIKFNIHSSDITKIDFDGEEGSPIRTFNHKLSFSIAQGFQRPSPLIFFKFNLLQNNQFSLKSILFKCFIAFVMNVFLKPFRVIFDYSSIDFNATCGLDNSVNMELGYDFLLVSIMSHSEVFHNVLNLTSSLFNNATSLNNTEFSNLLMGYRSSVQRDYYDPTGIKHAKFIINSMSDTSFPSYPKYLEIIDRVTFEDYMDYCNSILSFNELKGMISGNISYKHSKIKISDFVNSLNLGSLINLKDPLNYNLPILTICPTTEDKKHFLLIRRQVEDSSLSNLVLASVFLEKSWRNFILLMIVESTLTKYYNIAMSDNISLSFNWVLRNKYIQLYITSISPVKTHISEDDHISEYTTVILDKISNIDKLFDLKLTDFFIKARRVLTVKSIGDQNKFDLLFDSYMLNREPYFNTNFLKEFEKLSSEDISNFSNDFMNSIIYLVIVGSKRQLNMNVDNRLSGFVLTDGYPNV